MIERLLHHRVFVLLSLLLLFVLGLAASTRLQIDNTPEIWLPADDGIASDYERFKSRFGSDAFIGIVFDLGPEAVSAKCEALAQFAASLRGLEGIHSVRVPAPIGSEGMADAIPLVSRSGRKALLAVVLDDAMSVPNRKKTVTDIEHMSRAQVDLGYQQIVGTDVLTRELDNGSEQSFGGLFPLVAAILSLVVLFAIRSGVILTAILLTAILSATMTLATMALVGVSLNLLLVLVPAILVVLTVAASLHLCWCYLSLAKNAAQTSQANRNALWGAAVRKTIAPCALTTATTALGFASLATSEIMPVRNLGIFTALGSIWVLLLVFTLIPTFGSGHLLHRRPAAGVLRSDRLLDRVIRHRRRILWVGGVMAIVSSLGLAHLRIESNVLEFFASDHPLPSAYRDFEEEFFGLTAIEFWVEGPAEELASHEVMEAIDSLCRLGHEQGWTGGAIFPLGRIPRENQPAVLRSWLDAEEFSADSYHWQAEGLAALRITLTAPTTSSNVAHRNVVRVRDTASSIRLPERVTLHQSGAAPLLVHGQVLLLQTQVHSFVLALILITAVVFAVYRSLRLTVISLVANMLPVSSTLGIMGWLDIPLDAGTITVAGIALGLVVDDTIHLLDGYAASARKYGPGRLTNTIRITMRRVGPPILITSVAVALGFGAFGAAAFQPTRYFGLLIAFTCGVALFADLLLVPALLLGSRSQRRRQP